VSRRGIVDAMKAKPAALARRRGAGAPFLHRITSLPERIDPTKYPFNIRAFSHGIDLAFRTKVTFLVGVSALISNRVNLDRRRHDAS
jgi:hypothetical protein